MILIIRLLNCAMRDKTNDDMFNCNRLGQTNLNGKEDFNTEDAR
jgi:hypothetical protein